MTKQKQQPSTIKVAPAANALVPVSKVTNEQKDQYTRDSAKYRFEKIIFDYIPRPGFNARLVKFTDGKAAANSLEPQIVSLFVSMIGNAPRLFNYDPNGIRLTWRQRDILASNILAIKDRNKNKFNIRFSIATGKIQIEMTYKPDTNNSDYKSISTMLATVGFCPISGGKWEYINHDCTVEPTKPVHPKKQRKIVKYCVVPKKPETPAPVENPVQPLNMDYIQGTVAMLNCNLDSLERERQGLIDQLEKVDKAIRDRQNEIQALYQQVQDWQKKVFG